MSKCLRLIPHIANNPTRMRQVTERCSTQLIADNNAFKQLRQNNTLPYGEDITAINLMMGNTFEAMLRIYLTQATNTTLHLENKFERNLQNISAFSLNCDPIAADKLFFAEMENSENYTKEAFQTCKQFGEFKEKSLIAYMAQLQFEKFISEPILAFNLSVNYILDLREDFDLKADALGKWT
ncbi:hypothetical protein ILYODFUR_030608 [Ilyodon furcidens]|uniref:Uncharacterized protein n=1 Tax=Ilyodon furcidens TaxID=33524 RepID=A0ABV0UBK0_9TELE